MRCRATTKTGNPCSHTAANEGLCGIHHHHGWKPKKPATDDPTPQAPPRGNGTLCCEICAEPFRDHASFLKPCSFPVGTQLTLTSV